MPFVTEILAFFKFTTPSFLIFIIRFDASQILSVCFYFAENCDEKVDNLCEIDWMTSDIGSWWCFSIWTWESRSSWVFSRQ